MSKKVVLFDFDGVIVGSADMCYRINKKCMPDLTYEEWQSFNDVNVYRSFSKVKNSDAVFKSFSENYAENIFDILPVKGMNAVVRDLAKEYDLLVITSSYERIVEEYLVKHCLRKHFKEIMGVETHKSKVEKLKMVVKKYKIEPSDTILITDTVGDIREAHEVGVKSLGVIWGCHGYDKLARADAHFIAARPIDLVMGIEKLLD